MRTGASILANDSGISYYSLDNNLHKVIKFFIGTHTLPVQPITPWFTQRVELQGRKRELDENHCIQDFFKEP